MKIIFLDHQGVMFLKKNNNPGSLFDFDSNAIIILNQILLETDAEIVVSSDWKLWVNLDEMKKFYSNQGIIKQPIDYTPKYENYNFSILNKQRSKEIIGWLNKKNISKWVSIDYLNMTDYLENFVLIKTEYGINEIGIKEKILKFLN